MELRDIILEKLNNSKPDITIVPYPGNDIEFGIICNSMEELYNIVNDALQINDDKTLTIKEDYISILWPHIEGGPYSTDQYEVWTEVKFSKI